jgi:hypothetical protein
MRSFKTSLLAVLLVFTCLDLKASDALEQIIAEIKSARTADDLYTARMNLKRLNMPSSPSESELLLWQDAYRNLALGFRNRNHYRNGVIAFYQYLDLREKYLERVNQQSIDSIVNANSRVAIKESREIKMLSDELADLKNNRSKVVDLRLSYRLWGTVGSVLIILIFSYLIYKRHHKIMKLKRNLESNREYMMTCSDKLVESALLRSSVGMMRSVSSKTAGFIDQILKGDRLSLNSEDRSSLEKLNNEFRDFS